MKKQHIFYGGVALVAVISIVTIINSILLYYTILRTAQMYTIMANPSLFVQFLDHSIKTMQNQIPQVPAELGSATPQELPIAQDVTPQAETAPTSTLEVPIISN